MAEKHWLPETIRDFPQLFRFEDLFEKSDMKMETWDLKVAKSWISVQFSKNNLHGSNILGNLESCAKESRFFSPEGRMYCLFSLKTHMYCLHLSESFQMSFFLLLSIYIYLLAKRCFDTAENEPSNIFPFSVYRLQIPVRIIVFWRVFIRTRYIFWPRVLVFIHADPVLATSS